MEKNTSKIKILIFLIIIWCQWWCSLKVSIFSIHLQPNETLILPYHMILLYLEQPILIFNNFSIWFPSTYKIEIKVLSRYPNLFGSSLIISFLNPLMITIRYTKIFKIICIGGMTFQITIKTSMYHVSALFMIIEVILAISF